MDWYLMVWKKYAQFDGRSRRTEYWMFALFNFLALIALVIVGGIGVAISKDYGAILFAPLVIYFLAAFIPGLSVVVRRLHDTGRSGMLLLLFIVLGFIPFVGFISSIVQIVFMCQDSDPGPNQYGPNPKNPGFLDASAQFVNVSPLGIGTPAQPPGSEMSLGFCKNCGATLPAGSPFCQMCGTRV
jgi:uncharacterized membrane protein YhaH (DUF805 family)